MSAGTASPERPRRFAPPADKLDRLYELIEDIEVALLTTRRADGSLVSRPMATQRRADGAHFWFVAAGASRKVREIAADSNVNLSYHKERTREWISVSGRARVSRDRAKIRELYEPTWKVWFPERGAKEDGGPEDPRMVLIAVDARAAHFMTAEKATPTVLFEAVRTRTAGERANVGELEEVTAEDLV